MSEIGPPRGMRPPPAPRRDESDVPPPPSPRHGCLTALMILAGIILLLPGLCALLFSLSVPHANLEDVINAFVLICLLVGLGGIALIWAAIRGLRS